MPSNSGLIYPFGEQTGELSKCSLELENEELFRTLSESLEPRSLENKKPEFDD